VIDIISITEEVIKKIKKIVLSVTKHTNGIFVGVDKSGYSGYSYKTNYAENTHQYKYEIIKKKNQDLYLSQNYNAFTRR
tara:strand:+ start:88 stop:324 length:237 start_codon:yes stop_codon:yes gene_type:complete